VLSTTGLEPLTNRRDRSSRKRNLRLVISQRKRLVVLSRGHIQDFTWMFVVARDASSDRDIRPTSNEQLGHFRGDTLEVRQRMEDRRLTSDAVWIDLGAGVHIGSSVEQDPACVDETVFGGDVEERAATNRHQTSARRTTIEFGIATVDERRVGVE